MAAAEQPFRLPSGGAIDRSRRLRFRFDGRDLVGHPGDTLAAALLANGVDLVARSFKYHRPRGIFAAGPEEPNALLRVGEGAGAEPNARATTVELADRLIAASQNRWPSLGLDFWAVNSLLAPLFPAGFYYKTFMRPQRAWPAYERFIRRAAGIGEHVALPDPDRYEKRFLHCDVLVVGGGPAGLAAADAAAATGARVVLAEERPQLGGTLRFERRAMGGEPAARWLDARAAALAQAEGALLLRRTTAFGCYDHNHVALVEDLAAPMPVGAAPRQRLWLVRAQQIVLAAGSIERPLVFCGNDRPGIMLASAARRYVNQYGVAPGRRAVVFTNNGDAYRSAIDLHDAGVPVAAIVDARTEPTGPLVAAARERGIPLHPGHAVVASIGARRIRGVRIGALEHAGRVARVTAEIACDLLCVSGGWNPAVHLHSQAGGSLGYDVVRECFVPKRPANGMRAAGAAAGVFAFKACVEDGFRAGAEAAAAAGFPAPGVPPPPPCDAEEPWSIGTAWAVDPPRGTRGMRFVDLQNDVTAEDVALAARENYRSVEHLKRYTTLGMGTDQGKTSNVIGLGILAQLRGEPVGAAGTTTFRPPYTPVRFGALAARDIGRHFEPERRTPLHDWHAGNGAMFVEAGAWLRPRAYLRPGESFDAAWRRETLAVRRGVGLVDVSTLGKIDIQGPDALAFIERVYCNGWQSLALGRARYGLMLREDGIVLDDGTTSRIAADHYFMTTTTANAGKVLQHLEFLLEVVWPELRVQVASVTDQWAQMALAGPLSRTVLAATVEGADVGGRSLPHLGVIDASIRGRPVRIFRLSFSGELAYEIATPSDYGTAVWQRLMDAGAAFGIAPYGTEALGVLRIERGHIAGPELDGRTTAADLGLGRMVSRRKDFVGRRLLERAGLADPNRPSLVGLEPVDGETAISAGSILVADAQSKPPVAKLGHVTSATYSPTLARPIALALLAGGSNRKGETLIAAAPVLGQAVAVRIVDPAFFDPRGERLHG